MRMSRKSIGARSMGNKLTFFVALHKKKDRSIDIEDRNIDVCDRYMDINDRNIDIDLSY